MKNKNLNINETAYNKELDTFKRYTDSMNTFPPSSTLHKRSELGVSGIIELVIALVVLSILIGIAIPYFGQARASSNNSAAQQSIKVVNTALGSVYGDIQDYGYFGTANPSFQGACSTSTQATVNLLSQIKNVTLTCTSPITVAPSTVTFLSGELSDGNPGGWIGLAALSVTGTCWQLYIPADGSPVYGSTSVVPCVAPTSAPGGTPWS